MQSFNNYCQQVSQNYQNLVKIEPEINKASLLMLDSLKQGGKIIFCGNGGSAADAQHLSAELMGRFLKDRRPLPSIALTVDTSALTAIANDYSFGETFSRQLEGIGNVGDCLIAISTSGNSKNIIRAVEIAKEKNITRIGLTGSDGGALADCCQVTLKAPSNCTNHIQEMHIGIGHYLCFIIENSMF
jgi:D-sedoheptulose 7-phosphate isomerase